MYGLFARRSAPLFALNACARPCLAAQKITTQASSKRCRQQSSPVEPKAAAAGTPPSAGVLQSFQSFQQFLIVPRSHTASACNVLTQWCSVCFQLLWRASTGSPELCAELSSPRPAASSFRRRAHSRVHLCA
jgi:hypothetical protein